MPEAALEIEKDDDLSKMDRGDEIDETEENEDGEEAEESEGADEGDSTVDEGDGDASEGDPDSSDAEEDADDADDADDVEKDSPMIPKARFDEAQRKARARQAELETKLSKLEKQEVTKATSEDITTLRSEISDLKDQYETHLLDGETAKAREVRKQLDEKEDELLEKRLSQKSESASSSAIEQIRYDIQLAEIEAKHPQLNPDSEEYNEEVLTEVAEVLEAFKARGYTATAALQKAVKYVVPKPDAKPSEEDAEIKRQQRGHQARKKAADAKSKTPPDLSQAGKESTKHGENDGLPDVTKMSPEQFAKVEEAKLRQMRGDAV